MPFLLFFRRTSFLTNILRVTAAAMAASFATYLAYGHADSEFTEEDAQAVEVPLDRHVERNASLLEQVNRSPAILGPATGVVDGDGKTYLDYTPEPAIAPDSPNAPDSPASSDDQR